MNMLETSQYQPRLSSITNVAPEGSGWLIKSGCWILSLGHSCYIHNLPTMYMYVYISGAVPVTDHSHHRSKRNNGLKELTPGDRESCKPGAVGVLIGNIIISMKMRSI